MVKDYSEVPCAVKIINNTTNDVLFRIGYIFDDIIFHNNETIVEVDNSEVYARIGAKAKELGLEVEVVTPGPVPPPVEHTILEKGKKYVFMFKNEVPEFEDEVFFNEFLTNWDLITIGQDEGNNWGVIDGDFTINSVDESLFQVIYEPTFRESGVGGWTAKGEHSKIQGPKVTFEDLRIIINTEEVDTLDITDIMFLFNSVTEIPEN